MIINSFNVLAVLLRVLLFQTVKYVSKTVVLFTICSKHFAEKQSSRLPLLVFLSSILASKLHMRKQEICKHLNLSIVFTQTQIQVNKQTNTKME